MKTAEQHLKDLKESLGQEKLETELARFCRVAVRTPQSWVRHGHMPGGGNLIALRTFLSIFGREVSEWQNLKPLYLQAAKAVGFDLISPGEIKEAMVYVQTQDVLNLLLGKRDAINEREQMLSDFVEKKKIPSRVKEEEEKWQHYFGLGLEVSPAPVSEIEAEELPREEVLFLLAQLVKTALPLAEYVVSDRCSDKDRERLREIAGQRSIFELKNNLVRLSGARAHRDLGRR